APRSTVGGAIPLYVGFPVVGLFLGGGGTTPVCAFFEMSMSFMMRFASGRSVSGADGGACHCDRDVGSWEDSCSPEPGRSRFFLCGQFAAGASAEVCRNSPPVGRQNCQGR